MPGGVAVKAKRWRSVVLLVALAAVPATGEPLDLGDARPRWVGVAFEVSPADRPAQLRSRYSARLPARLEPTKTPGELRITIGGHLVEEFLLTDQQPAPGSFGDFTWVLDSTTGHVRSARLSGILQRKLRWGPASWKTDAQVEVRMDTLQPIGFEVTRLLGETYHRLCAKPDPTECTVVEPRPLDPRTGYVNAVGTVTARSGPLGLRSFSPLGEAVFTEIDDPFDTLWKRIGAKPLHAGVASPPAE